MATSTSRRPTDLSSVKRQQILSGARAVFAEVGYERGSVDEAAARAGVSKATVYNHFHDKKTLFVACFSEGADELRAELLATLAEPTGDVEPALQHTGEKLLKLLVAPDAVCLFRQAAAESARFPEVGETFFERVEAMYAAVASFLERWDERGALEIPDPRMAAVHFVMLCQGDLVLRARLGTLRNPPEALVRRTVRSGVARFLRAYAP